MQKTFIKYTVAIMTSAILLILLINFLLSRRTLENQQFNTFHTLIYLLFVEAAVILLLYCLVKWKVMDGIHCIIDNLSSITEGNLDTTVEVGGNREFEELSGGI